MRQNLIDLIKSEQQLSSAIILTHNIDFIFLQLVVLPALKVAGQPKLTIFVDALCAAETYEAQAQLVGGIGTSYRVVPLLMPPGFRFHPKAVLLSGPENAKLFIGSGNLTYGGWVENAEIWVELDASSNGTAPFASFFAYLQDLLTKIPFPESVGLEIQEAFDPQNHSWATDLAEPAGLLGVNGAGVSSMLDQITTTLGDENPVNGITVCAPYYDKAANALKRLSEHFGNPPTRVFIQNGRSTLLSDAAKTLPSNIELIPICFKRENPEGTERESFLHAKYFAFQQTGSVTVFSGSANCSNAALTLSDGYGNAELMVIQSLTPEDFQERFVDDLQTSDEPLRLIESIEEKDDNGDGDRIIVIAVRMEGGKLFVGYRAKPDIRISKCLVDGYPLDYTQVQQNEIVVNCNWPARYIRLSGEKAGSEILSNLCWVDHERQLRITSRGRWLAESIRKRSQDEFWGLGAWAEIMDAFSKHLNYIPPFSRPTPKKQSAEQDSTGLEYTEEDIFSSSYGLGSLSAAKIGTSKATSVKALKELLLRWFGAAAGGMDEPPQDPPMPDDVPDDMPTSETPDTIVDLPVDLIKQATKPLCEDTSEEDRARVNTFINKLVDRICSLDYLENRPLEMMADDLNLMAVMLLAGRRENWLSREDFIRITERIWTLLFLSTDPNQQMGWIEYRVQAADPEIDPLKEMCSPKLSATLAAWSLSIPLDFSTAEQAGFTLCSIMSVARLPELWIGSSTDQVAEALESDLLPIVPTETFDPTNPEMFGKKWNLIIRLGRSVSELERALGNEQPFELKELVNWSKIPAGTLLWQGPKGFMVTVEPVERTQQKMAKAIALDGFRNFTEIQADFLIPMKHLINSDCDICKSKLKDAHRKYLKALSHSISKGAKAAGKVWVSQPSG